MFAVHATLPILCMFFTAVRWAITIMKYCILSLPSRSMQGWFCWPVVDDGLVPRSLSLEPLRPVVLQACLVTIWTQFALAMRSMSDSYPTWKVIFFSLFSKTHSLISSLTVLKFSGGKKHHSSYFGSWPNHIKLLFAPASLSNLVGKMQAFKK